MSVGSNLQEMENVVTKGASPAEPMQKLSGTTPGQTGSWEDLGGPTPENYRSDDDSAKLKYPSLTLSQVKNVVNAKASAADAMMSVKEETEEDECEEEADESEEEEEEEEDENSKKKKVKKNMKEEAEDEDEDEDEEVEEEEDGFDVEEDVQALLAGEELSEEFQEKARTIFESAIKSKVNSIKENLEEIYSDKMVEELNYIKEELVDRVDSYLEYVADEWIAENKLAIQSGLQSEMTESFLSGLKGLFEEHYVSIPEEKYDVVYNMVDKLDEMEEKLNEQIEKNVALNKRLAESVSYAIFSEISEGLALSQKDKLASLVENVEFECEENYRQKIATLRESYFPSNVNFNKSITENLSEEMSNEYKLEKEYSSSMNSYISLLDRSVANKM